MIRAPLRRSAVVANHCGCCGGVVGVVGEDVPGVLPNPVPGELPYPGAAPEPGVFPKPELLPDAEPRVEEPPNNAPLAYNCSIRGS